MRNPLNINTKAKKAQILIRVNNFNMYFYKLNSHYQK